MLSQILRTEGRLDHHAVERANELDAALGDLNAGAVLYGHHTSVLILSGESQQEIEARCALVGRLAQRAGYIAHPETYNGLEAFIGSLPGHTRQNVRKPIIHSLNFADLVPISREWLGEPKCPSPFFVKQSPALALARSSSGARFHLNLHVGDVGHTLMLGPTGAGKSTLLAYLASQFFRYESQGAQIFAFDKGLSLLPLCAAIGQARPRRFRGGGARCSARFKISGARRSARGRPNGSSNSFFFKDFRSIPRNDLSSSRPFGRFRTLQEEARSRTSSPRFRTPRCARRFGTTRPRDRAAPILDGERTHLPTRPFTVFEIEELMNLGPKIVDATLLYLFHYIETELDGSPTLLLLDEAWLALSHALFSEKIREWLKVLRKSNCAVVLATQSLSDVVSSPIRDAVLESCPTRLLLPNPEAESAMMRQLYRDYLRLDEAQVALLAGAEKKRQYYYTSPTGTRLFELNLGPVALSFLGASSKPDLAAIGALRAAHEERWPAQWLRQRGLEEAAARWMTVSGTREGEQDDEEKTLPYRTLEHALGGNDGDGRTLPYAG